MRHTLIGQLPRHVYCFVDSAFTHAESKGFTPAVWFGLVSYPGRMFGCTVMLECGAVYRNLPPHAIAFEEKPQPWDRVHSQHWDCYGWDFTAIEYDYLAGLDVLAKCGEHEHTGEYLFTVAPVGDAFSAAPEQAKEFVFVKLDNGRLTIQPTDRVVFRERSFTGDGLKFPVGLKRQTEVWNCE